MSKEEKDIIDDLKQGAENGSLFSSLWGMLSKRAKYVLFATIGLPVGGGVGGGAYLYNSGADLLVNITKPAFERAGFVIIPDSLSFPKKVEHNVYVAAIKMVPIRVIFKIGKSTRYFLPNVCGIYKRVR